jgi:signal transduction histidine kinase
LPDLTNAQQVIDLGLAEARRSLHRARVRGVVTFPVEGEKRVFVQDETAGLLVAFTNANLHLEAGQFVQVNGNAGAGLLAPMLIDANVEVLGKAPMPQPRPASAPRLAAGELFGQWISIEGVVRDVAWNAERRILFVSSGGLRFHAIMQPCAETALHEEWLDARVELQGVCWTDVDRENKATGFTLYSPGTNHVAFRRAGTRDVFDKRALARSTAEELRHQSDERVKLAGTVTYHAPNGTLFLRDGSGGFEARLLVPLGRAGPKGHYLERGALAPLQPGARVEIVGAPTETAFAPVLHDAEVRPLGSASVVQPAKTSAVQLLSGGFDRQLVSLTARVLAQSHREMSGTRQNVLVLQNGDTVFEGFTPESNRTFPTLANNSYLTVSGICLMQPGEVMQTRTFRLLLRDPAEVWVTGRWSPWRSPEAAKIGGIAVAAVLAALVWIWLLRRRVAQRTGELAFANRSLESEVEERKRAQAELGCALEAEKQLSQLNNRFVSMVSHEFRTPLAVIMSAADILRKYADRLTPERRVEHLREILDATKQMGGMMEQILLLGRVDSGRLAYTPLPLDLAAFGQKLTDEQLSLAGNRCPIVFSSTCVNGDARADEGLLRHIFTNLLSNAVKYSRKDSRVYFMIECVHGEAICTIRDGGIGIPESEAARLFTAFHRCANVGDVPGTGLGLLIVKRCVELHGGTISFTSQQGGGTTFTVRLPLFDNSSPTKL